MLLEYFALNDCDADARQYVYGEILCHYVFEKKERFKRFPLGKT